MLRTAQEAVVSCVNAPAQHAALAALTGDQQVVADAREHYRANIDAVCEVLSANGIRFQRPQGSFYLWVDVSHVSGGDVAAWCERFLVERRVAVAPGSAFGAGGEGWIRLSLAGTRDDVLLGASRIPAR
jgi:aspartate aminotransferase